MTTTDAEIKEIAESTLAFKGISNEAFREHFSACVEVAPILARWCLARLSEEKGVKQIVNEQASDEGLWFEPVHITEDYLQKALRRLHEAIEGKTASECAIDFLTRQPPARQQPEQIDPAAHQRILESINDAVDGATDTQASEVGVQGGPGSPSWPDRGAPDAQDVGEDELANFIADLDLWNMSDHEISRALLAPFVVRRK